MIALNFLDKDLIPFSGKETVKEAKSILEKYILNELPLLNHKKLKGIITKSDLHNYSDNVKISELPVELFESVGPQCHFFEIWSRIVESHLSCIPVVNDHDDYMGCIRQQTLLQFYGQSFALTEPGCIVVLSQRRLDYSLSKIAAIVEEEDCIILSSFVTETSDKGTILITIKLNCLEAQGILNSFERYGLEIVDVFSEEAFSDVLKERFNMLMNYLNL
ncbi:MAG: CBS domain-containing protein [Saprospiraceae bacterium]|nr:CBS domain-containing protein [Saprospiraceae bacterium]MBK8450993.1 CBS domain-containing protein [Saprospiraceae bacterium]MBK8485721.1 CBS domain-containing protein [Saprospiraceae bacterium]MBK9222947.1 CBS domain-containing protein [Saprospiraceae bacterium]MBK9720011.1 CBS domain-containing protein [Saprospiraceae bacterium]